MGISSTWINSNGNFGTWIQYNPMLPNVLWNVCKWDTVSMQCCLRKGISSSMNILVMDISSNGHFLWEYWLHSLNFKPIGKKYKVQSTHQIQTLKHWIELDCFEEQSILPVKSKLPATQKRKLCSVSFSSTSLHLEMHNYIPCTRLSLKLILQTTRKITRQIKSFVSVQFGSCLNAYLCASLPNTGMLLRTDIFSSWWWNSSSYFPHQG